MKIGFFLLKIVNLFLQIFIVIKILFAKTLILNSF